MPPDPESARRLVLLGSMHISDPQVWYYKLGQAHFEVWYAATEGQKRLILVEGTQLGRQFHGATAVESIERYHSEAGLLHFWGAHYNIPVISSELPDYYDLIILLKEAQRIGRFSWQDVLWYYGSRELPIWYRMKGSKPPLEFYMQQVMSVYNYCLQRAAKQDGIRLDYDFSYETYQKLHFERLGFSPVEDPAWVDPTTGLEVETLYLRLTTAGVRANPSLNPTAYVSQRCLDIRDHFKAMQFKRLWERTPFSPFSWQGILHTKGIAPRVTQLGEEDPPIVVEDTYFVLSDPSLGHLIAPTNVESIKLQEYRAACF